MQRPAFLTEPKPQDVSQRPTTRFLFSYFKFLGAYIAVGHHMWYSNCTIIRYNNIHTCGNPATCFGLCRTPSGRYWSKKNAIMPEYVGGLPDALKVDENWVIRQRVVVIVYRRFGKPIGPISSVNISVSSSRDPGRWDQVVVISCWRFGKTDTSSWNVG